MKKIRKEKEEGRREEKRRERNIEYLNSAHVDTLAHKVMC